MGKRIISQRRGRGTSTYKSPSHRYKGTVKHRPLDTLEKTESIKGKIIDLVHCPGHSAPLAKVRYEDGTKTYIFAPLNIKVGTEIESGAKASTTEGNTLPLENIPEGTFIYNIETQPGDGGKLVRCSGTFARVVSHLKNKTTIMLPSKKQRKFDSRCRATIGVISGSGRVDKPFVKAGKKMLAMRARNKLYPRTSGVAMNAVDHPFGSGRGRHAGKPTTTSRDAPPGRKVGMIGARRTGRKKR